MTQRTLQVVAIDSPEVPRLALSKQEAAQALGVSTTFFEAEIAHELRMVRRGRVRIVPVSEIAHCIENRDTPLPPQRLARDQRMQPVGLYPHGRGLALAGRAAPLGSSTLVVGSGEPPLTMLAGWRLVLAAHDVRCLAERHHRGNPPLRASVVNRVGVHRCLGCGYAGVGGVMLDA